MAGATISEFDGVRYLHAGGSAIQSAIRLAAPDRLELPYTRALLAAGEFGAGSMRPKVEAAVSFIEHGGERSTIAALERATDALAGRAGTRIVA